MCTIMSLVFFGILMSKIIIVFPMVTRICFSICAILGIAGLYYKRFTSVVNYFNNKGKPEKISLVIATIVS